MNCGKKKNQGSAVIEMTLLMPVILGCIFLSIMVFLYFADSSKKICSLSEVLYQKEGQQEENLVENIQIQKKSGLKRAWIEEEGKWFRIQLELWKDAHEPVENIRRWQLAAELF